MPKPEEHLVGRGDAPGQRELIHDRAASHRHGLPADRSRPARRPAPARPAPSSQPVAPSAVRAAPGRRASLRACSIEPSPWRWSQRRAASTAPTATSRTGRPTSTPRRVPLLMTISPSEALTFQFPEQLTDRSARLEHRPTAHSNGREGRCYTCAMPAPFRARDAHRAFSEQPSSSASHDGRQGQRASDCPPARHASCRVLCCVHACVITNEYRGPRHRRTALKLSKRAKRAADDVSFDRTSVGTDVTYARGGTSRAPPPLHQDSAWAAAVLRRRTA